MHSIYTFEICQLMLKAMEKNKIIYGKKQREGNVAQNVTERDSNLYKEGGK